MTSLDETANQKSKLVYLWPGDSHDLQEAARQLGYYGYQVGMIDTPAQLVADSATRTPTCILIDCSLACGQSTEFKAELAALSQRVPIACMSDRGDIESRLEAVRIGCQAYFTRPLDTTSLLDTLDRLTAPPQAEAGKVLIIDDSPSLAAFYAANLAEAGFLCQVVTDPLKSLDAILEQPPELILLDMNMPGASGQEVAKVIRQQDAYLSIPIVFLSAESDVGRQREAMSLGGDEFLQKPIQPEHLVSKAPNQLIALQNFCHLLHLIHAKPKVHIYYMREAYVSDDDQVRVTIDRKVYGEANLDYSIKTEMHDPALCFKNQVILELKFTNRFPDWFRELVRVFGVMQCGAAKYCESVQGVGFTKLQATHPVLEEGVKFSRSW